MLKTNFPQLYKVVGMLKPNFALLQKGRGIKSLFLSLIPQTSSFNSAILHKQKETSLLLYSSNIVYLYLYVFESRSAVKVGIPQVYTLKSEEVIV